MRAWMKRCWPDTLFGRLFALVLVALLVSHLLTFALLAVFDHPPPGFRPPPGAAGPEMGAPPGNPGPGGPPPGPRGPSLVFWSLLGFQFVLVAGAVWLGARQLTRPMQSLASAANRLGDNLNDPPLPEQGTREARHAARAFNRMQRQLQQQMDERARFLAAVSHDLRTPLTRIRLRIAPLDSLGLRQKLENDIDEMAAMLDATLQYLRGQAQAEPWQSLDIQALLESMVDDALENGDQVTLEGHLPILMAQPSALRRCVGNLLENAIRYGGEAHIRLVALPDAVQIHIADNGPGIPENRMASVFEPFVRLEESRNRHTGGVGMGLAIARELAQRHGGQIALSNAAEGGLVATLTLPRLPAPH